VHWSYVGSARGEDGIEDAEHEEESHEEAEFPCAKITMSFDCVLTLMAPLTHALICVALMLPSSLQATR